MTERIFCDIQGISVGSSFATRKEATAAVIYKPLQAGISDSKDEGADSIVISGGYEDDFDSGDEIIYTGEGGQDDKGRLLPIKN